MTKKDSKDEKNLTKCFVFVIYCFCVKKITAHASCEYLVFQFEETIDFAVTATICFSCLFVEGASTPFFFSFVGFL